jgi:iron-sulfur cluster repair protein YtfE (RIC family)
MRPSDVRRRVLSDHEELRGRLDLLERLAEAVRQGGETARLRAEAESLLDRLAIHMSWEDLYLVPVLREADAWGEVRTARFADEHREQRELLEYVLRSLHDQSRPGPVVASNVLDFVALLRADMVDEESAFLDEHVLRDDPIAIDLLTS